LEKEITDIGGNNSNSVFVFGNFSLLDIELKILNKGIKYCPTIKPILSDISSILYLLIPAKYQGT